MQLQDRLLEQFPPIYDKLGKAARDKAKADAIGYIATQNEVKAKGQLLTIERDMERSRRLSEALATSADEYDLLQRTFALLDKNKEIYERMAEASGITTEEVAKTYATIDQGQERLDARLQERAQRAKDIAEAPWRNFEANVTQVTDDFWTNFSEKGFDAFNDLGDGLKKLFHQLEADILRSYFEPIRKQILEAIGIGVGGPTAGGFVSAAMGGARGLTGVSVAANAVDQVSGSGGNDVLYGGGGSDSLSTGGGGFTNLLKLGGFKLPAGTSKILGKAAAAYVAYDLTTTITRSLGLLKNETNAKIGATIGAIAGGPIGSAIGAFIGGFLGPKPTNATAAIALNSRGGTVGSQQGTKATDETVNMLNATTGAIKNGMDALTALGAKMSLYVSGIEIGTRDMSRIHFSEGSTHYTAVGDPTAAADDALKSVLANSTFGDSTLNNLAQSLMASGAGFDEIIQSLTDMKNLLDAADAAVKGITDETSQWQDALQNLSDKFTPIIYGMINAGQDVSALNAAWMAGLVKVQTKFQDGISDAIKEIEAPTSLQFETLIKAQQQRLKDAAALQIDMTNVNRLNALEISKFVENLSQTGGAIGDIDKMFADLLATARALGQNTAPIEAALATAKGNLISGFNDDIGKQFRDLTNPTLSSLTALLDAQKTRLQQARDLGANIGAVERLNALEQQRFFEGLSDDQKNALGDYLGIIESYQGRIAVVLSRLGDELGKRIDDLDAQRSALEDRASTFKGLADGIASTRQDLADKYSPLSPQAGLTALRKRFSDLGDAALGGNQSALTALPQLAQQLIEKSRGLYGSTTTFRGDLDMVQRILGQAETSATETANLATSQAESLVQQVSLLTQIRDALQSPDPALDFLQQQTGLLDQNNKLIGSLLQSYIDLSNLQNNSGVVDQALLSAAMQRAQEAISGLNQSLTPTLSAPTSQASASSTAAAPGGVQSAASAQTSASGDQTNDLLATLIQVVDASGRANVQSSEDTQSLLRRAVTALNTLIQAA